MTFWENLRMAFQSLRGNGTRSILALLGVVIGVFAVTAMISLGQMLTAGISRDLEAIAGQSIIVQPNYQNGMNLKRLKETDLEVLARLPVTVNPQLVVSSLYDKKPGDRRSLSLVGTEGDLPALDSSIHLVKGRYFTRSEAHGAMAVAVLNPKAATELLGSREPIGRRIRLYFPGGGRADLVVVGILEPMPAMFGGNQPQVNVPTPFLWHVHPDTKRGEHDYAILKARPGYNIKTLEKQTKKLMEARYSKGTFDVQSGESMLVILKSITLGLQAFLGAIAGLSLLVGGIGIMNIMLVSVTERTREIGLRKALGATSGQIRQQFLIEAVLLTLLGGAIGVLFAALVLWLISATVSFLSIFVLSPLTIFLALFVSSLVGLIFGVWPAGRAAKLDPIESLRYE